MKIRIELIAGLTVVVLGGVAGAQGPRPLVSEPDGEEEADEFVFVDDELDVGPDVSEEAPQVDLAAGEGGEDASPEASVQPHARSYGRAGVDTHFDEGGARSEDVVSLRWLGEASMLVRFPEAVTVKVAGRADAELHDSSTATSSTRRFEARLWDTYAQIAVAHLDVRFGNQFVVWGNTDLLNPNDVVNARDLRRGFLERPEDLRVPVLALEVSTYAGPFTLSGLWVPAPEGDRFEVLDGDHALLGPLGVTPIERGLGDALAVLAARERVRPAVEEILALDDRTRLSIDDGELGGAATLRLRHLDLGLYVLWGHERTPVVQVHPELIAFLASGQATAPASLGDELDRIAMTGERAVALTYPRKTHWGASAATRIEPFGLRADAAFTQGTVLVTPPGGGPLSGQALPLDEFAVTLAADFARGTGFNVSVEVGAVRVLDLPAETVAYGLNGAQALVVASSMQWVLVEPSLTLSVLGFLQLGEDGADPALAIAPRLRWSHSDRVALELAYLLYEGPVTTAAGRLDGDDQVQVTWSYAL